MELNEDSALTPSLLISFVLADIEIFLLQNESQTDYKEQDTFTRDEIINQLRETGSKMYAVLKQSGVKLDEPIGVDNAVYFDYKTSNSNLLN